MMNVRSPRPQILAELHTAFPPILLPHETQCDDHLSHPCLLWWVVVMVVRRRYENILTRSFEYTLAYFPYKGGLPKHTRPARL